MRKDKVAKITQIMGSRTNNTISKLLLKVWLVYISSVGRSVPQSSITSQVLGGVLTRDGVEEDEVLKVGYLSALPALGHVGGLE